MVVNMKKDVARGTDCVGTTFKNSKTLIQKVIEDAVIASKGSLFRKDLAPYFMCIGITLFERAGAGAEIPSIDMTTYDRIEDGLCDCLAALHGFTELGHTLFQTSYYPIFIRLALSLNALPPSVIARRVKNEAAKRKAITPKMILKKRKKIKENRKLFLKHGARWPFKCKITGGPHE